jgi:hypothetical protein
MPTHSFNFGIGGMYLPETAYLLEQILNLKPRNLRWVFIEYDELKRSGLPRTRPADVRSIGPTGSGYRSF